MLNKKIIIITVFLVSLLAISAVNAADNITEDVGSVASDNSFVGDVDSSTGTFTDLANEIANAKSELTLTKNYTYTSQDNLAEGITIKKEITINGNGFTIDGNNQSRAFVISSKNVLLKDISFTNCFSKTYGGAVLVSASNVNVDGCIFHDNLASDTGGAIYVSGANVKLANSIFYNNSANEGSSINWKGKSGSIDNSSFINTGYSNSLVLWKGDNGIMRNTIFNQNSHNGDSGGTVYWGGKYGEITESNFTNNYGSAIYWTGIYGTISKSNFIENFAGKVNDYSGGAIYMNAVASLQNPVVENCSFIGNVASFGGAIYTQFMDIINCSFINNCAVYNSSCFKQYNGFGGAVYSSFTSTDSYRYVILSNNRFINNMADSQGGAIYGGCMDVSNCSFTNNKISNDFVPSKTGATSTPTSGGAGYLRGLCSVVNSTFINNSATAAKNIDGITYYIENCTGNEEFRFSDFRGTKRFHTLDVSYDEFMVESYVRVNVKVPKEVSGTIKFSVPKDAVSPYEDKYDVYTCEINNGFASVSIYGGYGVSVKVEYNGGFESKSKSIRCIATRYNASLSISMDEPVAGNDFKVYWDMGDNYSDTSGASIIMHINNRTYSTGAGISKIPIIIRGLPGGNYNYSIEYVGGSRYNSISINGTLTVVKNNLSMSCSAENCYFGEDALFDIKLSKVATGNITLFINNKYIMEKIDGDRLNMSVPQLAPGKHDFTVSYSGNENYSCAILKDSIEVYKVKPNLIANDFTTGYGNDDYLIVKLTDGHSLPIKGAVLSINLNGLKTLTTDDVGQAKLFTGDLIPGDYVASITFAGDEFYSGSNATVGVVVKKISSSVVCSDISEVYGDDKNLVVTLKTADGTPISGVEVLIDLNGLKSFTSNDVGQVKLPTNDLAPNTYTAKITFAGNTYYDKATKSVKLTVKKATPKLSANSKVFKSSLKTKKYTVTLKTNKNKIMKNTWISLNVNKKTYKVKTNAKGQATFKITNLKKKGIFTAVVKYAGSKYYNAKTVKPKIIIR